MRLCRIGSVGEEKPAIIDSENNYRDLSSIINDLNPDTLNFLVLKYYHLVRQYNLEIY